MIDNSASQNRAQGMMSWLYDVDGVLYFDITHKFFNPDKAGAPWDPWKDPSAFDGWGDGTLVYPGKPSIIGGTTDIPVGSIRLQLIREGFQDYEYMKLVSDLGDPGFAQTVGQSLYPEVYLSNQGADRVNQARLQLAQRIQELTGPAPAWTRLEQTDPATTLTGNWYPIANSLFSGGSAVETNQRGARATFSFAGTGVRWIGYRDRYSGIADVYLDGTLVLNVDSYAPTSKAQAVQYVMTGLVPGNHTLVVEATGQKNRSAVQAWVWLDAFEYVSPPPPPVWVRLQQDDPRITRTGNWYAIANSVFSGGSAMEANQVNARATLNFTGTAVRWLGFREPSSGIGNVYLDGVLVQQVDLYAPSSQPQAAVASISGLLPGNHTLVVEVSGLKNASAKQSWIWLDAFDYST
jgi:hypothetical protein